MDFKVHCWCARKTHSDLHWIFNLEEVGSTNRTRMRNFHARRRIYLSISKRSPLPRSSTSALSRTNPTGHASRAGVQHEAVTFQVVPFASGHRPRRDRWDVGAVLEISRPFLAVIARLRIPHLLTVRH